jgi:hypothetical protein
LHCCWPPNPTLQALDQIGALLRMVLIVIRDMRYFFMMLLFLLISFGLTFSVLMSPATTSKVNIVSLMGSRQVAIDEEEQVGDLWQAASVSIAL